MKLFIIFCLHFFISENSALTGNKIKDVEGHVEKVSFDSNGNIYVVANLTSHHQLYKLNPDKELLWDVTLTDYVYAADRMYVTKQDDIYFTFYNNTYYNSLFAIVKANATDVEYVEEYENGFFYKDENDNLFYNKYNSVHVFKPNSVASVPIQNTENVHIYGTVDAVSDKSGNAYFAADNYLAVVTEESLQEEIPYATFLQIAENKTQFEVALVFDERGDLWLTIADLQDPGDFRGIVKKLKNGTLETVTVDPGHPLLLTVMVKDRIFIMSSRDTVFKNDSSIYYITLDNDIVRIPELSNLTFDVDEINGIADSEGFVYFYTYKGLSPSLGPIVVLKPGEIKPNPIQLEIVDRNWIDSFKFDFNEDVWIGVFQQGLYYLKKGEYVPEKVELPADCNYQRYDDVYVNTVLREVYFTCYEGFYVVSN